MQYAGFCRRLAAFLVDLAIASLAFFALAVTLTILLGPCLGVPRGTVIILTAAVVWQMVSWLYWAAMESSSKQSTVGKGLLHIVVTDVRGGRVSFRQATARHFAKIVSTLVLLAGFLMIGLTPRKQGLHDLITASHVVVRR